MPALSGGVIPDSAPTQAYHVATLAALGGGATVDATAGGRHLHQVVGAYMRRAQAVFA